MNFKSTKSSGPMLLAALLAFSTACADTDGESVDDATADQVESAAADAPVAAAAAAVSGLLGLNEATADQLRGAGVPDAAVAALLAARPFDDMIAADAALADVLDDAGRESTYRVIWIPLDLNRATREEILLIPGVGDRMAHEFEEYRPYDDMAQFRREIGKYVDDEELERLARYVRLD